MIMRGYFRHKIFVELDGYLKIYDKNDRGLEKEILIDNVNFI